MPVEILYRPRPSIASLPRICVSFVLRSISAFLIPSRARWNRFSLDDSISLPHSEEWFLDRDVRQCGNENDHRQHDDNSRQQNVVHYREPWNGEVPTFG